MTLPSLPVFNATEVLTALGATLVSKSDLNVKSVEHARFWEIITDTSIKGQSPQAYLQIDDDLYRFPHVTEPKTATSLPAPIIELCIEALVTRGASLGVVEPNLDEGIL